MERQEINILQLYNKICTISSRLPEYDENKKGFDMCLVAFKEGLKDCPSVNLGPLTKLNKALELKVDDLTQDNKVLNIRLDKLYTKFKKHEQISRTKSTG
jgi:hypothetical protein